MVQTQIFSVLVAQGGSISFSYLKKKFPVEVRLSIQIKGESNHILKGFGMEALSSAPFFSPTLPKIFDKNNQNLNGFFP